MHLIIGTDIWGRTPHVEAMAESFADVAKTVTIVDPYAGEDLNFSDEETAFSRFIETGGHARYAQCVADVVAAAEEPVCLLGFSAGAGAVWSAVNSHDSGQICCAMGFYGASIRTMMDVEPVVPVDLIFSDNEKHFDVEAVARDLQDKANVQCYIAPFVHGFMNPAYAHFDTEVYLFWVDWIKEQLLEHCAQ
ncbi:MAG: dienelactone hydrolase family protein [Desulfovibrionales bacterium]|nr:dienelactone hydrolase family protein [Desulfovibrionales bacterium]